jgi:hypothetical protein
MTGTIAITMAGFGTRFARAGYSVPKYEIMVMEKPLFDWSMLSLSAFCDAGWEFVFAVRAADESEAFIRERCRALKIPLRRLMLLSEPTDGQATTAKLLADIAPPELPFAIFNIDTFVRPGAMSPEAIPASCSGWVPCFPGEGEGWSFVRLDENGRAMELREKKRISPHATVGLYWFQSAELYCDTYNHFFAHGGEELGERYVAPLYNQMIFDNLDVRIQELAYDDVGQLGTPEQVESFKRNPPASALGNVDKASF